MEHAVPLVVYKDGERHIVGTAVMDDSGKFKAHVYDAETQDFLTGSMQGLSLGPSAKGLLEVSVVSNASLGAKEIEHRFGFHKATIEGADATLPKHRDLRLEFRRFATLLDEILPDGRAKRITMTCLETVSMWAHKAVAETAPVIKE